MNTNKKGSSKEKDEDVPEGEMSKKFTLKKLSSISHNIESTKENLERRLGMVAHTCNPSTFGAEAGGLLELRSSRPA